MPSNFSHGVHHMLHHVLYHLHHVIATAFQMAAGQTRRISPLLSVLLPYEGTGWVIAMIAHKGNPVKSVEVDIAVKTMY